jgi:hypothetical protein
MPTYYIVSTENGLKLTTDDGLYYPCGGQPAEVVEHFGRTLPYAHERFTAPEWIVGEALSRQSPVPQDS